MRVLVLGAYGLIGLPVVRALLAGGHAVTGVGRSVKSVQISYPEAKWLQADIATLTRPSDWIELLTDIDAVVNCSGALQDGARDKLRALQSHAMIALFEACERSGVKRLVQVSAAGVSEESRTLFLKTKAVADAALQLTSLDWIILRPGLVIAPTAYGGTSLIRALAAFPFVTPVIDLASRIQTVDVDDVAQAVVRVIAGTVAGRQSYDILERERHSLEDVIVSFRRWMGLPAQPVIRIPAVFTRPFLWIGDSLGHVGWRPPIRTTAFVQLGESIQGSPDAWVHAAGPEPSPLAVTLACYPSSVQEKWFARLWLLKPLIITTLTLFWLASGVVGLVSLDHAAALLPVGDETLRNTAVLAGSLLDILLGIALLIHSTHKQAALGMLIATAAYLVGGTILTPGLWLDPLGPLVKTVPCAVLALVALATAEER
jgi:uncharacterized protein YbjT (DUF2867 family)